MASFSQDLSLRHLPDLSETSFQIPSNLSVSAGDLLLGDDDFLKDEYDNISTPIVSARRSHEPLTLSELTPKQKTGPSTAVKSLSDAKLPQLNTRLLETIKPQMPVPSDETKSRLPSKTGPKSKASTQAITAETPVARRFSELKAEINTLISEDTHSDTSESASQKSSRDKGKGRAEQTGTQTRTKSKLPTSRDATRSHKPTSTFVAPVSSAEKLGTSSGSRLRLDDSNKIAGQSISLISAELTVSSEVSGSNVPRNITGRPDVLSDPLRLSELSPRKASHTGDTARVLEASPSSNTWDLLTASSTISSDTGKQEPASTGSSSLKVSGPKFDQHTVKPRKPSQHKAQKPTVVADGIINKPPVPSTSTSGNHDDRPSPTNLDLAGPNEPSNVTVSDGVAARLMIYGQNMMSAMSPVLDHVDSRPGLRLDSCISSTPETSGSRSRSRSPIEHISNHDHDAESVAHPSRAMSPLRPSTKRPSTTLDADLAPEDREMKSRKINTSSNAGSCTKSSSALRASRQKNSHSDRVSRSQNRPFGASASSHRTLKASREQKKRPAANVTQKPGTRSHSRTITPNAVPNSEKPVILSSVHPTKPIGFTFQLEARMEARKAEGVEDNKKELRAKPHNPLPVPDFKSLHLAHEASLAARKGAIVPIVPLPLASELNTEVRAREREKFDEGVKQKEAETARLKALRHREKEEEEEREAKEMRKKAVPKAHEVPEWYAHMPKREGLKGSDAK